MNALPVQRRRVRFVTAPIPSPRVPPRLARKIAAAALFLPLLAPGLRGAAPDRASPATDKPRADTYTNFAHLARGEREGVGYRIRSTTRQGLAVMAPHGGAIEPGTSEIAHSVAGTNFAFYAFEGLLPAGNQRLHVTSTRFDEPSALAMATGATTVVTVHGEASEEEVIFIGGRDQGLRRRITRSLGQAGFDVRSHPRNDLQGLGTDNLCNRGRSGSGIQLELSAGLRRALFLSGYPADRSSPSKRFFDFVTALRLALQQPPDR
jgi:phage replication-related protein YjqB (UPF0714/DUF867 family)